MEDPEGQTSQEVTGGKQASHRAQPEPCACCRREGDGQGDKEGEIGERGSGNEGE